MKGSEYVVHFDCGRPDAARLGGKGASLCRLVSQGHLVPPGFVVTVDAFYATCRHVGLSDALEKLIASVTRTSPDEASGEILRRGFASGSLPHDVRKAIADSVEILRLWNNNTVGLIARSSATSEDGAAHSFAGIFESLQVVNPESLESKVLEVWSSVFSPRALSYVRFVNLNRLPAMGVVVQRFLEASRSGVMFTTYPQRERRTLIEHVDGSKTASTQLLSKARSSPPISKNWPASLVLWRLSSTVLKTWNGSFMKIVYISSSPGRSPQLCLIWQMLADCPLSAACCPC